MEKPIRSKPRDWKEGRRFRAWELFQQGWKQCDIAAALGVTPGAVSQWIKRAQVEGNDALSRHLASGPKPKLTLAQRAQLPSLLARGAEAFGFRGDIWTTRRVATIIEREFCVHYHPAHVSRLLQEIGWTPQKPVQRAIQRKEAAIQEWLTERWPALKKRPRKKAEPLLG